MSPSYAVTIDGRTFIRQGTRAVLAEGMRATAVKFNPHHDERGRFATSDASGLGESLTEHESAIRRAPIEHLIAMGPDGQVLLNKSGKETQVQVGNDDIDGLTDAVLTHNHPGGGSFSLDDVYVATRGNVAQLRAVDENYRYSLDRPGGGWSAQWFFDHKVSEKYEQRSWDLQQETWAKITSAARWTAQDTAQANREHYHKVWTDVASELGLTYRRESW